ncbi:2-oxo-4-hydroxy-4-carboxy-5-ureidoimidazoline decarboxylase [Azospirillum fermentarium]|uniref:2-oxo-4-hydroxy-4-carboxy-5-ureidoimidazoline decarboxylase n=1 Tax=Azospirillum fermentarium TaxID=1233114 RepID=UPI0029CAAF2E|nr:2-oxo-4-hydroxy-4-carboxy-5-ureidoimidazoline decarboxylase [Azospirillum fermentarium]MCW2248013.1 2-oxo-4-hydroxy-4-carboxy-5-ureidoimidazoline decarboxylase [Azospirillum fermentarium]
MSRLSLDAVNDLDAVGFTAAFGGLAEHSPWVAAMAFSHRPFPSVTALHAALVAAINAAGPDQQLALLRAHPDLAGRAALAGELTASSSAEQAAAGLDRLTPEEMARFQELNAAYTARFGFPFILAVRHATKHHILAAYARRVTNTPAAETAAALGEVAKIIGMRLLTVVEPAPTGRLTVHALDTAAGMPARGLPVELVRGDGGTVLVSTITNADGRVDGPLLAGADLHAGVYELRFHAGVYFQTAGHALSAPPFLDVVPIRFAVANPEQHYHVPLLLSPWSYSTYRGS